MAQGLNAATNAFLSWSLGQRYNFTLLGLTEMPKPGYPPRCQVCALLVKIASHDVVSALDHCWNLICLDNMAQLTASLRAADTKLSLDFASLLGPIFFTWLVQQLLPFMLVTLVNEKERGYAVLRRFCHSWSKPCLMFADNVCCSRQVCSINCISANTCCAGHKPLSLPGVVELYTYAGFAS